MRLLPDNDFVRGYVLMKYARHSRRKCPNMMWQESHNILLIVARDYAAATLSLWRYELRKLRNKRKGRALMKRLAAYDK